MIEAQKELTKLVYPSSDIIDCLFSTYSAMYFKKIPGLEPILADLSKVTEIFLKWKQGLSIVSNCLPLLLSELAEPPKRHSMMVEYNEEKPIAREELPQREIGARELARLIHAKVVTE